jgi:hypothetical protein
MRAGLTGRTWLAYDSGAIPGPTPGQRPRTTGSKAAAFKNKCGWQTPTPPGVRGPPRQALLASLVIRKFLFLGGGVSVS